MLLTTAVLASTLAWSPSAGQTPQVGVPARRQGIVGSRAVELGAYDAVVSFLYQSRFCTGTVVAPRLVLTAGHCLDNLPVDAQTGVSVRFGVSAQSPAATVDSEKIGVYPDACLECLYERHDLGYIVLSESVEFADGFPVVITDQDDWDATVGPGRPVTMVGFGQVEEGTVSVSEDLGLGTKRAVDSHMRPHGDAGVDFLAGADGLDTCQGDSGGPAFVTLEDGSLAIAGVLSGGLSECGGGDSVYSVPLPALAWIRDETGVDLLPSGCPDADCIDMSVPEEGCGCVAGQPADPLSLSLAGLVLGWIRRRREWAARPERER